MVKKYCKKCLIEKEILDFPSYNNYCSKICKKCRNNLQKIKTNLKKYGCEEKPKKQKQSKEDRLKKIIEWSKNNWTKFLESSRKSKIKNRQKRIDYYNNNRIEKIKYSKEWSLKNKDKINENAKNRRKNPIQKLRINVSSLIRYYIKNNKNNKSCIKFLPYSINQLKNHLESLFESWMTWENYGKYNSGTWDDNNKLTWTWQIDHIIPQSTLPYLSMEDENFKKCWALENLRPYSAKQNLIDGTNKVRHITKENIK